ncbi:hypothetical protein BGZ93_003469 [Podila epicladia]|nr:hypothetical protein BGZ92_006517 [Podila epicladia]KAG0097069.1 hypothetical protein BGZ93_003469 [Podila epicladia]
MALPPKQPSAMDSMENYSHLETNHSSYLPLPHHRSSPLDILEILERILYLVPPAQLDSIRLVSHRFNQASFRPRWKYPNLAHRGMAKFGPRFRKYGHVVLELDFTESYLYSPDALRDVEFLITHCPNVRMLALPFGCLTFTGVERLIAHYAAQRQLHTLRLDMTKHSEDPHMTVITQIRTLRCLSIRFNDRSRRMMDFDYEDLFEACPLLHDLTLVPAPGFQPSSPSNHDPTMPNPAAPPPPPLPPPPPPSTQGHNFGAVLNQILGHANPARNVIHRTTEECLKYFEDHRPKLRRLHLDRVWFRDAEMKNLALSCPDIDDLRISNMSPDFARRSLSHAESFSLKTVLEAWPRLRKLQVDGNKFSVGLLKNEVQYVPTMNLQEVDEASPPSIQQGRATEKIPATGHLLNRCMISSLCLFKTHSLDNDDLITIVNHVASSLHYLNIDGCQKLTDHSVRYVLMTCSSLLELSAAELNLTMALFEDKDPVDRSLHKVLADITELTAGICLDDKGNPEQQLRCSNPDMKQSSTVQLKWACARTLRTLDLSWREHDGRPKFIPINYGRDDFVKNSDTRHILHAVMKSQRHGPWCCHQSTGHLEPEAKDVDSDDLWAHLHQAGTVPSKGGFLPMFRKRWSRSTIYERLKHLERIEVLLLQGWKLPWNGADLLEHCFSSSEMDRVSGRGFGMEMEELDLTLDRVVVQFLETSQVFSVIAPPSLPVPSKLQAPVLRGLGALRHLDIRCKDPFFYSHEEITGFDYKRDPLPLTNDATTNRNKAVTGRSLRSALLAFTSSSSTSTSSSSSSISSSSPKPSMLYPLASSYPLARSSCIPDLPPSDLLPLPSPSLPPPPPPPPPPVAGSRPIPPPPPPDFQRSTSVLENLMHMALPRRPTHSQELTDDELGRSDILMFSFLGTVLQICPRLEIMGVAPATSGGVLGWNVSHAFDISLAKSKNEIDSNDLPEVGVGRDGAKNVEGQESTPHANVQIVPGRRSVHCTVRPFPELAVIRQW